jgi:hypothetical protein
MSSFVDFADVKARAAPLSKRAKLLRLQTTEERSQLRACPLWRRPAGNRHHSREKPLALFSIKGWRRPNRPSQPR